MEPIMLTFYRATMDSDINPLRNLPPAQRFQAMVLLSVMWTTIFCTSAGAWLWYGELIVLHVLVALGFLVTGLTFHRARQIETYRDHPRRDGTARYDDVWGA
jgi:hypothetical protein